MTRLGAANLVSSEPKIMTDRDEIYIQILEYGLIALKNAAITGNVKYWATEAEHLHNVPSLIGDSNEFRHRYYFDQERVAYLESVDRSIPEIQFTLRRYDELWAELEPLIDPRAI